MEAAATELEELAAQALGARDACAAQRAALGRYALVWWSGVAAERYWQRVEERRSALARCGEELEVVASLATSLARVVRFEAERLRALSVAA